MDKQVQAAVAQPEPGFVAFGAKADGLYQRRNGHAEEKLAIEKEVIINQAAHGFAVGNCIKLVGSTWVKAKADSASNAGTVGLVSTVVDANNFKYLSGGLLPGTYTNGANYFLSPTTAGAIFIQSDPEVWDIGNVREFIGTGTANGLEIEIDLGQVITEAIVPTSIWDLAGVDRTGWAAGKILKFDVNGNLVVGIDLQGEQETGIQLSDLSGIGAIAYNPLTGVFSIASGYAVPTTAQLNDFITAFGWGNHANAGYLTAITKALVEAVLTGNITTHSHSAYALAGHSHDYDNYGFWVIGLNDDWQMSFDMYSQFYLTFYNGLGISFSRYHVGSNFYGITAKLNISSLTQIQNPTLNHFIAIQGGGDPSRITLDQLKTLIGGGGGGTSDHAQLTNLGYDQSGHTGFARLAGSSTQDFATKNLTAAETVTATGEVKGEKFTLGDTGWSFEVSSGKLVIKHNGTALMSLDTAGNIKAASEIYRGGL